MNRLLDELENQLGSAVVWQKGDSWLETEHAACSPRRALMVEVRDEGCVEVSFRLERVAGSPFEAVFPFAADEAASAVRRIVEFVAAILSEELVLAMMSGFFRGGRKFLSINADSGQIRRASWVASWKGRYDRAIPVRAEDLPEHLG